MGEVDDEPGRLAPTVVAMVQAAGDALAAEVAERVVEATCDPGERASVVVATPPFPALVSAMATHLADVLAGRGEPPGGVVDVACELAAAGASPSLVRRAVHVTVAVVTERLVTAEETERPGRGQARLWRGLEGVRDAEFEVLDAFESAVREADADEATRVPRLREVFLRSVVEGPVHDPESCARRGMALGVDLTPPIGLVLMVDGDPTSGGARSPAFEERVLRCARRPRERVLPPVFVDPTPAEPSTAVVLVPAFYGSRRDEVCDALEGACHDLGVLGVQTVVSQLVDVPIAYHRLRRNAPLLERCGAYVACLADHDDLLPYRQAGDVPSSEAEALVRDEVGPLMVAARYARERVETWKLLIRERLSDTEAAERLDISVSAFGKRKQVIRELTGRTLTRGLFRSQLASYVFELWEADLPPPGDPWWSGQG